LSSEKGEPVFSGTLTWLLSILHNIHSTALFILSIHSKP
jgi:hypothetical protein